MIFLYYQMYTQALYPNSWFIFIIISIKPKKSSFHLCSCIGMIFIITLSNTFYICFSLKYLFHSQLNVLHQRTLRRTRGHTKVKVGQKSNLPFQNQSHFPTMDQDTTLQQVLCKWVKQFLCFNQSISSGITNAWRSFEQPHLDDT